MELELELEGTGSCSALLRIVNRTVLIGAPAVDQPRDEPITQGVRCDSPVVCVLVLLPI